MIATTNQSHVLRGGRLRSSPPWDEPPRDDAAASFFFCPVILAALPLPASGLTPRPVAHLWHVLAVLLDVVLVPEALDANRFLVIRAARAQPGDEPPRDDAAASFFFCPVILAA